MTDGESEVAHRTVQRRLRQPHRDGRAGIGASARETQIGTYLGGRDTVAANQLERGLRSAAQDAWLAR
jgi:hypothetical protein